MQQTNWLCIEHGQQICSICIDNHQCKDRRLCIACIPEDHENVDNKKMPSVEEFFNLLNEKLKDFKEAEYTELLDTIEQLQEKINVQFEKLKKQTQSVVKFIKLGDKQILELKGQLSNRQLQNLSREDYNYTQDILEGTTQRIDSSISLFLDQIEIMSEETISEQLDGNVKLKGQLIFGSKQGEFYYEFDNGTTEYAGKYELGFKQGMWNDYLGLEEQQEKIKFDKVKYLNGRKQDCWPLEYFDYKFYKGEDGIDVGGKFNQLIYKGQYKQGIKVGLWKEYYHDQLVGQGEFNHLGLKVGMWTEAIKNYQRAPFQYSDCQITFTGEYRNGIRYEKWNIEQEGKYIGGGNYDKKGVKIRQWTDLDEKFNSNYQVTFTGQYRNGIRFGKWTIAHLGTNIGGGNYDDKGIKTGLWTQFDEKFHSQLLITFTGEYKNGIRFGKWSIVKEGENIFSQSQATSEEIIGGGNYDEKGVKIGIWTELDANFNSNLLITMTGEYVNGNKVGKWTIAIEGENIGGGNYDEKGVKIGLWTDLDEKFDSSYKVVLKGEYRNGNKFGNWKTSFYKINLFKSKFISSQAINIGGGNYDDNGEKSGLWTELETYDHTNYPVTSRGEYKNGRKIGKWEKIKRTGENLFEMNNDITAYFN